MNGACRVGYHADPDNTGQCIRCGAILDPLDEEERAEVAAREAREAEARAARRKGPGT